MRSVSLHVYNSAVHACRSIFMHACMHANRFACMQSVSACMQMVLHACRHACTYFCMHAACMHHACSMHALFRREVYLLVSGLRVLQTTTNSKSSERSFITFKAFLCVLARPPFLSFSGSSTKLKSPPIMISSLRKAERCSNKS